MEFPTFADMSLNSSSSDTPSSSDRDRGFTGVDAFYHSPPSDDDNYDVFDIDSSGTRSPAVESPTHKRYLYPQKEFVDTLRPEELRWFHRSDSTKKWQAFIGYDSLRIECRYRALAIDKDGEVDADERILVLGGLYEVDVVNKKCFPVYWSGMFVCRSVYICVCVHVHALVRVHARVCACTHARARTCVCVCVCVCV